MGQVITDARYGLRQLRRAPGFTIAAILTLALGIGGNTALFSLLDAALFKELPVPHPEQLVSAIVTTRTGGWMTNVPAPLFDELKRNPRNFSGVFAFWQSTATASWNGEAQKVGVQFVSGGYYSTLGVSPFLGRLIGPSDDEGGRGTAAVLDYRYWASRFNSDPLVLGKTLVVDGVAFTIIGITPPGFFGADRGASPEVTVPLGSSDALANLWVMARMKPGVTLEQARTETDLAWQRAAETLRPQLAGWRKSERDEVLSQRGDLLPGGKSGGRLGLRDQIEPLRILAFLSAVLMVIGCANIANLLLARSAARRAEIATRLAIGSTRGRLVRQLLVESGVLALLGGAVGIAFAFAANRVLAGFMFGENVPTGAGFALDYRLLLFTLAVSVLCAAVFGLLPALRSTDVDLQQALKRIAGPSSAALRMSGRYAFVVWQVAACVLLLAAAALLERTLTNLRTLDRGFNADRLLLVRLDVPGARSEHPRPISLYEGVLARVEAIPGVESASLGANAVFGLGRWNKSIWVTGRPGDERQAAAFNVVSPGFFSTTGTAVLLGRDFSSLDRASSMPVAIVNETFARDYCAGRDPIGCRFGDRGPASAGHYEVIGVVRDSKYASLRDPAEPMIYQALMQEEHASSVTIHIRTRANPGLLAARIHSELQDFDRSLGVHAPRTAAQQMDESLRQDRMMATLSAFFAATALMLTCLGLFGVVSYEVEQRTREIGIRVALGAGRTDILRVTLGRVVVFVSLGAAAGLVLAVLFTRTLRSLLFGVAPADPATLAAVVLLLLAVALAAAYLPARRATQTDPLPALRHE